MTASKSSIVHSSQYLWPIVAALIVIILIDCGISIWDLHQQTIKQSQVAVTNLGTVLTEQTARYMQVVDLTLLEVQSRVANLGITTPEEFVRSVSTEATRDFFRDRLKNLPQANAFSLLTADGRLFLTSRSQGPFNLDLSDSGTFRHFAEHDDPNPFISAPVESRVTGTPTTYIARRINGPNHILLGVVVGAIDLSYLSDFYQAIELPPGETVTLLRRDGLILARYPDNGQHGGKWMLGKGGTYRTRGYLRSQSGIVSVHPLSTWPLVINVAMREQVALAKWRVQATAIALGGIGTAAGFVALFTVISRQLRCQAEQAKALRASEARVRDFAEMSSDWLWEVDADLRCSWVSDSEMTRMIDIPSQLGMTLWEALAVTPSDPHWAQLNTDMLARRAFRDFRGQEVSPDRRLRHVSLNGDPVFDASGGFLGYRGTGRDITAEVEAARELNLARKRAEAASQAKSEFLANMTHELRTPLNAIIGFSELIRDQSLGEDANYVNYATDINEAGHHLLDMINDVLDLSKIEVGRYDLTDEIVDLSVVLRSCIAMLDPRAKAGGIRIDNATARMCVTLRGDGRALKRIVLNLLSNAVKFTPYGGAVSLYIERSKDGIALVVADTGIGIDAKLVQSLCQPFYQADTSISRKFGGSGLGLAISRKLLALHGAMLTIESTSGRGTTVRASFPCERIVEATGSAPTQTPGMSVHRWSLPAT
jgi:signal transduction histidine kinase